VNVRNGNRWTSQGNLFRLRARLLGFHSLGQRETKRGMCQYFFFLGKIRDVPVYI
jgi:hypothetical protein